VYLACCRPAGLYAGVGQAGAAGSTDRRHLRGCRRDGHSAHRSGAARGRASQADSDRKHPHQRIPRPDRDYSALCGSRPAALAAATSDDGCGIAGLGICILRDLRRRRDQLSRDCRCAPCFLFPDYSCRDRRSVRGIAFETAGNRLGCRDFGQRRRTRGIVRLRPADWSGDGLCIRRIIGARRRDLSLFARRSPRRGPLYDQNRALDWSRYPGRLGGAAAVAPRADQPLLDLVEWAIPSLRTLYFTRAEATTYQDASEYAEHYRRQAEELNERERRNRTEGQGLDDFTVARISSFLKSYGEMRKGEQFVMGEVRIRARERIRWTGSPALLACALLIAPIPWRRLGRWISKQ